MKRREEERRKEAREKEGCVFCASPFSPFLSLSFSSKSHPRLNFGFASKSLRERCSPLRLDVSIQLFSRRGSMDQREEERGGLHSRDPNPLYTLENLAVVSIYHRWREQTPSQRFYRISYRFSPIAIPVAYRNEDL